MRFRRMIPFAALLLGACRAIVQFPDYVEPGHSGAADAASPDGSAPGDGAARPIEAGSTDAPVGVVDASKGRCAVGSPFDGPVLPVPGLPDNDAYTSVRHLNDEQTTVYFATVSRFDGMPERPDSDLYQADRKDTSTPFGSYTALSALNSSAWDLEPTVGASALYFTRYYPDAGAGGFYEIFTAAPSGLGQPTLLVSDSWARRAPYLVESLSMLYLARRPPAFGQFMVVGRDLKGSSLEVTVGSTVVGIDAGLPSESSPTVTRDGRELFFGTTRGTATEDKFDIWVVESAIGGLPMVTGPARRVNELSTDDSEYPTWISPDGCTLYFTRSDASNSARLHPYYVTRDPDSH